MIRHLIASLLAALAFNAFAAIDANQASRADLETVKGIGPGLSAKIIKAREARAFKDWGDLVERVGGIGAGNAARLSEAGLTVGGAAYSGASATEAKPAKAVKTGTDAKEAKPAKTKSTTAQAGN
jgi:competence protein ComEA